MIGVPIADTKLVCMILFPRKVNLDNTYAAGAQIKMSAIQETTEYNSELVKNIDTFDVVHAFT